MIAEYVLGCNLQNKYISFFSSKFAELFKTHFLNNHALALKLYNVLIFDTAWRAESAIYIYFLNAEYVSLCRDYVENWL